MDTQQRGSDPVWRLVGAGTVVLLALLWVGTTPSLSGWTAGIVTNSTNSAATGSIAATHTYGPTTCAAGPRVSTQSCADSLLPAAASTSGGVTATSTIRNEGTLPAARTTQEVSAASCGTVQLTNQKTFSGPMLPRFGVDFQSVDPWGGVNAITLDGTGYAAAVTSRTHANATGSIYSVGVWFKANNTQSGPLLELGSNPTNAPGVDVRSLYLRPDGRLGYVTNATTVALTAASGYNDDRWHFALARFRKTATDYQVNVSVDSAGSNTTITTGLPPAATETGYWHLGWSPTAATKLSTEYFTGSLSNMVAFNTPDAPGIPTPAQLTSQAAFSAWAANATDHWLLGDTGTTTYSGSQPTIGTTSPCSMLSIAWAFSNPTATAVASTPLSTFATGTPYAVSDDAEPGATQRSTITVSRGGTYNSYIAGLRLYVPLTYRVQTTNARWPLTFTWASADSVVLG